MYGLNLWVPPKYVEVLIPTVTVFGPGASKEVIKVKQGPKSGALMK